MVENLWDYDQFKLKMYGPLMYLKTYQIKWWPNPDQEYKINLTKLRSAECTELSRFGLKFIASISKTLK